MTRTRNIDPDHAAEVREDILAWLHAHLLLGDSAHERIRSLRFLIHRNQYLHLGIGIGVYVVCVWSPQVYSAWSGRNTYGIAALAGIVVLGTSFHLILRRFGRIHLELSRQIEALEHAYCRECLPDVETLNWAQLQDLKRLRCILQANLPFDELESELTRLLAEPAFPSPRLRSALQLWLSEVRVQLRTMWPTPDEGRARANAT